MHKRLFPPSFTAFTSMSELNSRYFRLSWMGIFWIPIWLHFASMKVDLTLNLLGTLMLSSWIQLEIMERDWICSDSRSVILNRSAWPMESWFWPSTGVVKNRSMMFFLLADRTSSSCSSFLKICLSIPLQKLRRDWVSLHFGMIIIFLPSFWLIEMTSKFSSFVLQIFTLSEIQHSNFNAFGIIKLKIFWFCAFSKLALGCKDF